MRSIGICTLYTGFNYGSALQAAATRQVLSNLGYRGEILKVSGSLIPGRDVRLKKMLVLGMNLMRHLPQMKKTVRSYLGDSRQSLSPETKERFTQFYANYLKPLELTEGQMKKLAKGEEYAAFLCGSDQIWNSTTYYVDPFYYLTFAPAHKRIAFAPSFGRDYIAPHNRKKLKKYISAIPHLSIREDVGRDMIRELTGRDAQVLADPSLLLDRQEWCGLLGLSEEHQSEPYVLAYFLDEPSEKARETMKFYREKGYKILSLPYDRPGDWFDACISAGPREFLQYLLNAEIICTDSFHGTAFSLNFEKPFHTFERQYGAATKQSARLTSLLKLVDMDDRYDALPRDDTHPDWNCCRAVLEAERKKSMEYLLTSLASLEK